MQDTRFKIGREKTGGRTKGIKTQVKDFVKKYPQAVEELMLVIYEMGIDGDLEACKYFIDRIKGKPTSKIDMNLDVDIVSAVEMIAFRNEMDKLEEGSIEGEYREIEGTDKAKGTALQRTEE